MGTKRDGEAPLEALRLVLNQHAITLEPLKHQISALPDDAQVEYYFVPMQFMKEYAPFHQPGQPIKNLKLVNFGRPAVSISFFKKHKYDVKREPKPQEVIRHLQDARDELQQRALFEQLSAGQLRRLQDYDQILREMRRQPDAYECCFSNYHHYYHYWYCTFRYFTDATLTQLDTDNEHLLKHTERIKGQVHQRLNIIFVDPHYITRTVPFDNKLVDRELERFTSRIEQGKTALYIRKKT